LDAQSGAYDELDVKAIPS